MNRIPLTAGLAAGVASMAAFVQTGAYPQQPVKVVVGFAAGGPSDLVARAFADQAAKSLSQTVIVENRPGANAVLATERSPRRSRTATRCSGLRPTIR